MSEGKNGAGASALSKSSYQIMFEKTYMLPFEIQVHFSSWQAFKATAMLPVCS